MENELKAAQARIACLEGEIAKRDVELAACRVAVENCEVFRARIVELEAEVRRWVIRIQQRGLEMDDLSEELKVAHTNISGLDDLVLSLQCKVIERDTELAALEVECSKLAAGACDGVIGDDYGHAYCKYKAELAALKAQEPAAWKVTNPVTGDELLCNYKPGGLNYVFQPLYAATVSEAKAQGVVQWPDADEIMQMAFEEGQPADDASGYCFELEEFDLFIERLISEVARLNAAPAAPAADARLVEARKANNELVNDLHVMTNKCRQLVDALTYLRECLDPEDYMGEISMHDFIDDALVAHRAQELTKEPSHD